MHNLELFGGCGGLALGLSRAGFADKLVLENDPHAIATLAANQENKVQYFRDWEIVPVDVRQFSFKSLAGRVDLVSGGPPCQPFSIAGKHRGPTDERNMWPEAIRAVRETMPRAFIFENVQGLMRPAFNEYLRYIALQLRWPQARKRRSERWEDHGNRLASMDARQRRGGDYQVIVRGINTADYGAAQCRRRAIITGVRRDIVDDWEFPRPTNTRTALIWDKCISNSYAQKHAICSSTMSYPTPTESRIKARLADVSARPVEDAWVTIRDRFADLPNPIEMGDDPLHVLRPGARIYRNHTGSEIDQPAKALKAGVHGVPGGENMLVLPDGSVRYFTVREMARLQGFPHDFTIAGSWRHITRQLGNAVPAEVGESFGLALRRLLYGPDKIARAA